MSFDSMDARLLWHLAPEIVCSPQKLNFGHIDATDKQIRLLYVHNLTGSIDPNAISCRTSNAWLRIVKTEAVAEDYFAASFKIVVEIDPTLLLGGQSYLGWLEIQLEQTYQRVDVEVAVRNPYFLFSSPAPAPVLPINSAHWLRTFGITVAAIILVSMMLSLLSSERVVAFTDQLFPDLFLPRPLLDHHQIGFATNDGQALTLHLAEGQSGQQKDLAMAGWSPAWSSDGAQLAFLAYAGDASALYAVDVATGRPVELMSSNAPKSALAWAPDGRGIAFLVGQPGKQVLTVVNHAGWSWSSGMPTVGNTDYLARTVNALARKHKHAGEPSGFTQQFAWSPDGDALLFDYYQAEQARLLLVDVNGDVAVVAEDSWNPTWSPDGTAIAAVSAEGLFRMALSGDERHYLSYRQAHSPVWSPDGQWIAFLTGAMTADQNRALINQAVASAQFDLRVIDQSGQYERLLAEGCVAFAWSPDGQQLAYVTGDGQNNPPIYYLWSMTLGTKPTLLAEINSPVIAWKPTP